VGRSSLAPEGTAYTATCDEPDRARGNRLGAPPLAQAVFNGVNLQEESLEGVDADDVGIALSREHDEPRPVAAEKLDLGLAQSASHPAPIRKVECCDLQRLNPELKSDLGGDPRVCRTRVHDETKRRTRSPGSSHRRVRRHFSHPLPR